MAEFTPDQIDKKIMQDPEMKDLAVNDPTEFDAQHEKIYNSFGYNHDGTEMSRAMKGIHKVADATGIDKDIVQGAANVPIPLALGAGGAALGAFSPAPGGAFVGGAAGTLAGEHINRALGIRDKLGVVDTATAIASPLIPSMVSRAWKGPISNSLQGFPGAGQHMHNLVHEQLKKQLGYMNTSDDMLNFMRQTLNDVKPFRTDIPLTRQYIKDELNASAKSLTVGTNKSGDISDPYIQKLNTVIANMAGKQHFSFDELMATEKSFIAAGADDPNGIWKKLSGSLIKDLDNEAARRAGTPTGEKIRAGSEAYKNFVAVNSRHQQNGMLDTFLKDSTKQLDDGIVRFNKPLFLDRLKSEGFKNFEPTEIEALKKTVADLGYVGAAPKSLSSAATHVTSFGVSGYAAYSAFGVKGLVTAAVAMSALRGLMGTEAGRKIIQGLAKQGHGRVDGAELASTWGKLQAGMAGGAVAGVSGMGTKTTGDMPQTSTGTNPVQQLENVQ